MSAQEIIKELMKLSPDELAEVDVKLHELLQNSTSAGEKLWGEALLEVAVAVEGLPSDYAQNHDHYLHALPRR